MTDEERMERMMKCAYNPPGGFLCQMGGYPPFDCGFCGEYIDATKSDEEGAEESMGNFESVRVYVPTNELWGFYIQNKERCQDEMVLIAENTETGYAVYMTDDDGTLMFSVCKGDNEPEYEEYVMDDADCEASAKKLFIRYLVPFTVIDGKAVLSGSTTEDSLDEELSLSRQDMEDEMYEREDELDFAIKDFLAAVLQEPNGDAVATEYGEDFIQEVLHYILEYLTNDHCIKIFRPMFFRDDDSGSEIYSQFPYEEYTFSEGGNSKKDDGPLPD